MATVFSEPFLLLASLVLLPWVAALGSSQKWWAPRGEAGQIPAWIVAVSLLKAKGGDRVGQRGGKTRIVLADDHHLVRQGVRQLLEREANFEVVGEADNGLDAVRLAGELDPDIIIMEARMPKLSSVEATKRIKAEHSQAAVLVLTTYEEEEYVVDIFRAGASGYLLKSAYAAHLHLVLCTYS